MGELTTRETLFELMKVLTAPEEALSHPVEPGYPYDPWPVVRSAVALMVLRGRDASDRLKVTLAELEKLKELMR